MHGKDAIYPYRFIAFRILSRIADNFENKPEEKAEDLQEFNKLYDYKKIKAKIVMLD